MHEIEFRLSNVLSSSWVISSAFVVLLTCQSVRILKLVLEVLALIEYDLDLTRRLRDKKACV